VAQATCPRPEVCARFHAMSSIIEIEAAIEKLPEPQVEQLVDWLAARRQRRVSTQPVESWLQRARGAATLGVTTKNVMAMTRGEE
jgi:hypothetical protein